MQSFKNLFILERNDDSKDYFFINLISLVISSTFAVVFIICRLGLEDKYIILIFKSLIICYFIILFPVFLSGLLSFFKKKDIKNFIQYDPFFSLAGLLLIIIVSLISTFFNLIILISILSFICLLFFLFFLIKNKFFIFKDLFIIIFTVIFSLFVIFSLWSSKFLLYYSSPIFYEKLFTGEAFIDPLFHSAVSNMIRNYRIPSTGLNDIVYLPYHYLSHWIFAQFSKLLNVNTLKFYMIGYPLIFLPLFFKFFLLVIGKIRNKIKNFINNKLFWFFLLLVFTGFFPKFILERFFVSNFIIVSESYNLSITLSLLTFLLIIFFESKNFKNEIFTYSRNIFYIIFLPLLIFVIGLSKSSTMVIFVVVLFYVFLRCAYYRKLLYNFSAIFVAISTFFSLKITGQIGSIGSETSEFQLFHFFKVVIQRRNEELIWPVTLILFVFIYFFWSIIFIVLETVSLKTTDKINFIDNFKKKRTLRIEIVLLICMAGLLPGIVLKIGGGSANYFSELQRWLSIILLLSMVESGNFININIDVRKITKKLLKVTVIIVVIILILSIIYNFFIEFKSFYNDYKQNKMEYNLIINNNITNGLTSYRVKLLKVLLELDKLSINEKRNSLLYIPVDNTEFWDLKIFSKSLSAPLLVPAVSGIAMIYGLPDEGLIYTKNFGYSVYTTTSKEVMDKSVEELFYEIKQKGYKNLILLDYKNGEFSVDFINETINETNIEKYESYVYKLFRRLYQYSFGEHIEFEKLHGIVQSLRNKELTISEIIPEIILDGNSLINVKDNEEFVELLYLILLDRKADEKGLKHWLSEIEKGKTREEIINCFINSPEFTQKIDDIN